TVAVGKFIDALRLRTTLPITTEGEQLSSREAESRLAVGEKDWRKRKMKLDAAAAAVILQDFLDRRAP
ncbi:MAG: Holliday junction resolvase RuvX, partial [Vicinamibacterales bacterium]